MKRTSTQPEHFKKMTMDFYEAYQMVNEYIADLYNLPKKFVEEAEPAMERYMREYGEPGAPRKNVVSYPDVVDFMEQLDDLTLETLYLFKQHKMHFDKSTVYMKKVTIGEMGVQKTAAATATAQKKQLISELSVLNAGLMDIKTKADEMVEKMERLEMKWFRLKKKIHE